MTFQLHTLVRPSILNLTPYSSARDEFDGDAQIFLDANENAFGAPIAGQHHRYPDPHQKLIKKQLSAVKKVDSAQIFLGNGSDEAIDLLFRVFCVPGKDNCILLPPTYGMYEVSANINDIAVRKVQLTGSFQPDVPAILAAVDELTKLIFVCSPNNPSGNSIHLDAIKAMLEQFNGIVVVDEAYIDFSSQPSLLSWLPNHPNLVVLQTFSKAWGLANLRVGMAFGSNAIIAYMNKVKSPYNISGHTQQFILKALSAESDMKRHVGQLLAERSFLENMLQEIVWVERIFPSDANFILVKVKGAKDIYHYLVEHKIVVRDRSSVVLCDDCLRITVGKEEENHRLVDVLRGYDPKERTKSL